MRVSAIFSLGPLVRYVTLWVAHAPGMPETLSPPPWVSDPYMHHCTCVTHVPWCMPGSLTSGFLWSRWRGYVRGIPGACTTRNFTHLVRGPWSDKIMHIWITHTFFSYQIGRRSCYLCCSGYIRLLMIQGILKGVGKTDLTCAKPHFTVINSQLEWPIYSIFCLGYYKKNQISALLVLCYGVTPVR